MSSQVANDPFFELLAGDDMMEGDEDLLDVGVAVPPPPPPIALTFPQSPPPPPPAAAASGPSALLKVPSLRSSSGSSPPPSPSALFPSPRVPSPRVPTPAPPGTGPSTSAAAAAAILNSIGPYGSPTDIWPLRLIDIRDPEQFDIIFSLMSKLPQIAYHYLRDFIFPEVLRYQGLKLSACGQELGGDGVFRRRVGFSGTPSDLIPLELGRCNYEKGTDAKMMHFLTTPRIVSAEVGNLLFVLVFPLFPLLLIFECLLLVVICVFASLFIVQILSEGWSVTGLLDLIASATLEDPFHALIDTGALITGMNNYQVAHYLITHGLTYCDGVVFLDELVWLSFLFFPCLSLCASAAFLAASSSLTNLSCFVCLFATRSLLFDYTFISVFVRIAKWC